MSINDMLGIASAIAFLLPPIIILYSRYINLSLLALIAYFLLVASYNLMGKNLIAVPIEVKRPIGVMANYLDVPLMLVSMYMFCAERWKRNIVTTSLLLFFIYEVVIFIQYGLQPVSSKYIMGPGIVIVLLFSLYFFIVHIKNTIVQGKGAGKTFMTASILFAYGCYLLVYIFAYIIKTSEKADVFIIYYLASIIFSLLMSAGLIWIKKRVKQIEEVQTTRRELTMFFKN